MNFFDKLARTDTKGGIGVALAVLFVLALVAAMVTDLPFKEAPAWVAATLLASWLGISMIGKGVERATNYTYAAIKKGTAVPVSTGTTGTHQTTVTPPIAVSAGSDSERGDPPALDQGEQ